MFQRATVRGVAAVLATVLVSFTGCQYMPKVKMPSMPRLWWRTMPWPTASSGWP